MERTSPTEDLDLPVSPRARRLQALERGESDVTTTTTSRRRDPQTESSHTISLSESSGNTTKPQRRHRHKADEAEASSSPWTELCGVASPSTILRLLAALVAVLFVLDFTVESLAIAFCQRDVKPTTTNAWLTSVLRADAKSPIQPDPSLEAGGCSPGGIDLAAIGASRQRHRFYDLLTRRGPPTPPVFTGDLEVLCEPQVRHQSRFGYCLPIGGRTDEPFCARADRMDLLINSSAASYCYASVLHLILVEAYEELQALQASPLLAYGTLLGAVRNGSIISYTEDADLAYAPLAPVDLETFKTRLSQKGFHVFYFTSLWRVCVAPTHPLAQQLFKPDKGLTRNYMVPYVDLYEMKPVQYDDGLFWDVFGTKDDRLLPDDKVHPFSTVELNGVAFDTFADPVDFLVDEYGADFRTPFVRPPKKNNGFNFNEAFLDDAPKKQETNKKKEGN